MGSLTTEMPASTSGAKSKRGGADTLENEAVGLDVSVRIHGSQVAAVVLDTTEHVEPFEEDTSTMIVFPRGAVVKLRARVRTGHAVVLTNLANKRTALCRIIQVNSTSGAVHYVKLEFSQPETGIWGVHFPSDDHASAPLHHEERTSTIAAVQQPSREAMLSTPAPKAASDEPPHPRIQSQIEQSVPRTEAKPFVHEAAKQPPKPETVPACYGAAADSHVSGDVVPLAAAPMKRAPVAPKTQPLVAPRQQSQANSGAESSIFDSLSTGDEVFGKEASTGAIQEAILPSADTRAQAFARSLDPSLLLQSVETAKRNRGLKVFLGAAAVIVIGVGAAFYVKQYRVNTRENAAVSAQLPARQPVSAAKPSAAAPDANAPSQAAAETTTSPSPQNGTKTSQNIVQVQKDENSISVTPVHDASRSTTQNQPTISTGLASVYAGDLTTRPKATKHTTHAPLPAPLPSVSGAPGNLATAPPNAGLGSLVSSASAEGSALPKPVEPKPIVRGGVVIPPRLSHAVQPAYPALAKTNRVEGDVQIQALIDQAGKVISMKVISGPILLRRAAMDAVRQWRYSPAQLDGKAISIQYKVTVNFRLGQ